MPASSVIMGQEHQEALLPDIVREILLRLPVKTIMRFMCVCKSWHSLICQRSFLVDYHHRSEQNPHILITSHEFVEDDEDTDNDEDDYNMKFTSTLHLSTYTKEGILINNFSETEVQQCKIEPVQSCRGLVCLGRPLTDCKDSTIYICNPSTEEVIEVLPIVGCNYCIGFGYVAATKEFKVIRFSPCLDEFNENENCCDVYILGTSNWRRAKSPPPVLKYYFQCAPFIHGALHLLPSADVPSVDDCIYLFDIEKEEYSTIALPEYYFSEQAWADEDMPMDLKELGGSLCMPFKFNTRLDLWCMKDYNNVEWVKEYIIDLSQFGSNVSADPLAVMGDGVILFGIDVQNGDDMLCCYDPRDKSFTSKMGKKGSAILYYENFFSLSLLYQELLSSLE